MFLLAILIFFTCALTVVTGATSLLVIPLLLQFGLAPREAIGLNMAILSLMSIGGTLPFLGTPHIDWTRAPLDLSLAIAGSIAGAFLVFVVPAATLRFVIPVAMLLVLGTLFVKPKQTASRGDEKLGHSVVLLLSVYGGFLSGGYVTMLMASGMYFFRYNFLTSMATARLLNTASSLIAMGVFAWEGVIDWKMAAVLGPVGFAGALAGTQWAKRFPEKVLRRLFIAAVAILATKLLWDAV